ncbi:MAG: primosomal protein N' [Treponema sp.]|nr:primosomal protein N' [Treponema sp.]
MSSGAWFDVAFDIPADRLFTYRADEKGEAEVGRRALAPFGRGAREELGFIVARRDAAPEGLENIKRLRRVVDKCAVFDERDVSLAKWIAAYYICGIGQALSAMIPSGRRASAIPSLGGDLEGFSAAPLALSDEQRAALDAISARIASPPAAAAAMFYLYGITGSGKTEVFLRAAKRALEAGKSVIYLVPEISLTHQTAKVVRERFGAAAATLHSGMTPSERLAEWSRAREGRPMIVVGPRSAVFAPVARLGMIVIDEEHDGSYKSGSVPRYHARQAAMRRCSAEGAILVMGSATPSAEAWKLMAEGGITRLDLTARLSGGSAPAVKAVSLAGVEGCLTEALKKEIRATALAGRQSILFLNRRGFAHFFHCPSCGYSQICRRCSVSLTWHKSRGRAICHYCGYSEAPPAHCPSCGSLEAGYKGFGTEMIEEEVRRSFPDLRVRRADADSTAARGSLEETLEAFRSGLIDVLLGTQMVAKGLNFPGVRLVGVVLADAGLHLPDFRAAERAFSLIVQVAGRAGRYFPDGKVIVQTLRMDDPTIARACAGDVSGFFEQELRHRRDLGFPPYARVIRLTARSRDASRADAAIHRLAVLLRRLLPAGADMLGPAECPIALVNGNHRRQIILRGKRMGPLHGAARAALESYEKGKDARAHVEVDVDPVSLL